MESEITYIQGSIGIPKRGHLTITQNDITLTQDSNVVFQTPLRDITKINYMAGLNITIQFSDKKYVFTDVDWTKKSSWAIWIGVSLLTIVAGGFLIRLILSESLGYADLFVTILSCLLLALFATFAYKNLTKVKNQNQSNNSTSIIESLAQYFATNHPDKFTQSDIQSSL